MKTKILYNMEKKTLYFATLEYDHSTNHYSIPAIKTFECYLNNGRWRLCPPIVGDTFENLGVNSILEEDLDVYHCSRPAYAGYSFTEQGAINLIELSLLKSALRKEDSIKESLKAKNRNYQSVKDNIKDAVGSMLTAMEDIVDFDFDNAEKNLDVYDAMQEAMRVIGNEMERNLPGIFGTKVHNLKRLPN